MSWEIRRTEYGVEFEADVLESRALTPTAHGIRVTRHPEFDFEPVQFTYLSLRTDEADDYSDYRSMSLASPPTRDHLEYGARLSDSAWKRAFAALTPGDRVLVEGPAGDFVLDEARPAVMLAGGIGITPLKGMVEYVVDRGLDLPVRLVYSNRTPAGIAYRDELAELADAHPDVEVVHTITRPDEADEPWDGRTGRIDRAMLEELHKQLPEAAFYVCGTPGMVRDLAGRLRSMGVPADRITYEQFWGYED